MPALEHHRPLDWDGLLSFLAPRAIPGVESVEDGTYRRAVPGGAASVALLPGGRLALSGPPERLAECTAAARRLFALDADPAPAAAALGGDPLLGSLVRAAPGLRVPGCWDGFELAVRAILGQQVSVKGARTTAARLARELGERAGTGHPGLTRLFPSPAALAGAGELPGMPRARSDAIRALAAEVASGTLRLEPGAATAAELEALPGIGPWTAQYIAMRALADPDAWPAGDLGLRRALDGSGADPDRWRPYRAYAAVLLWRSLQANARAAA